MQSPEQELLSGALAGKRDCLASLLEHYGNYLKIIAVPQVDGRLRARVSASDIVQETLFEAHKDFPAFRGSSIGEFTAWLRQILTHNLARQIQRHVLAEKRDVRREVSLDALRAAVDRSAMRLEEFAAADTLSPSRHAVQREHHRLLADCLAALTPEYREVILLRNVEGLPFPEVALKMNRSSGAVRMLWLRAIDVLRTRLEEAGAL